MTTPTASTALTAPLVLSPADRHRAHEAVVAVAERLADPSRVARIAGDDGNRDPIYDNVMWAPVTLSNGWPGVATLFAELSRDGTASAGRWRTLAHAHLAASVELVNSTPPRGLFAGPGAVLAAAQSLAQGSAHYAGLRAKLADWLAQLVSTQLAHEAARGPNEVGVSWASYDLINGMAGAARLLLDASRDDAESGDRVAVALDAVLAHLVRIAEPITVHGHWVPGWWVPPDAQISDRDRRDYPEGDFNLGLAHGVAGPLAVLSHALRHGYEVPRQRVAITTMAQWLLGWMLTDEAGPYWPCRVSFAEEIAPTRMTHTDFTRTAWCYGAPGVAAALHAAGTALGVPEWISAATGALRSALARDEQLWSIDGPTICHGYAGLLAVCARVATDTGDPALSEGTARLTRATLAFADEDAPFVFDHQMRYPRATASTERTHRAVHVAGLLEGAAGVAAVLHSVHRNTNAHHARDQRTPAAPGVQRGGETGWERFLGLY
ncbi:MAG TPA: lanthionine synthetase C family protein [Pseudonocardiaceae bacterium]|nr:lanthionine synthetase C family protein [Pseudonocardiaceae bacterium]